MRANRTRYPWIDKWLGPDVEWDAESPAPLELASMALYYEGETLDGCDPSEAARRSREYLVQLISERNGVAQVCVDESYDPYADEAFIRREQNSCMKKELVGLGTYLVGGPLLALVGSATAGFGLLAGLAMYGIGRCKEMTLIDKCAERGIPVQPNPVSKIVEGAAIGAGIVEAVHMITGKHRHRE